MVRAEGLVVNSDVPLLVYAAGLSVSGTVPYFHGYTNNNCSTSSTPVTVPVGQRCSVAYRMNAYVHNSGGASSSAPVNVGTYNVMLSVSNSNLTTPSTLPVAVTVTARASETLSTNKVQVTGAAKTGAYVCYTKFSGTYGGVMSDVGATATPMRAAASPIVPLASGTPSKPAGRRGST